jgi:hypothetical protein
MNRSQPDPGRAAIVITSDAVQRVQAARAAVAGGVKHPSWCDPRLCTVEQKTGKGGHESAPVRIEMSEANAPCALEVRLAADPGRAPLVVVEVYDDPLINEALELDDEPRLVILTLAQSGQLLDALVGLLTDV